MGEALMKEEQLEAIGDYIKKHIADWIKEYNVLPFPTGGAAPQAEVRGFDISLTERIIRVEEAIKHQGELIEKILHQMDKRFEQIDRRFEQVDKRFEDMNKRVIQMFIYLTTIFIVIGTLVSVFGLVK